jgi:hypothetical protein
LSGRRDFCFSYPLGGCDAGTAEQDPDHSPEELRNRLRASQKGDYTLFMKAVAEAIIEPARYVEGTATAKSITPPAFNSTEFPHRLHDAETLNSLSEGREGQPTEDPFFQQRTA